VVPLGAPDRLTVDDHGDGLLVLTGKPAALEAVHRRWTEWWEAR
jgi:hypothetical protein